MYRIIREIIGSQSIGSDGFRIQKAAVDAIQEAGEALLVHLFESKFSKFLIPI